MNYQIVYTTSALKELFHFPEPDIKKIKIAIQPLSKNPLLPGSLKLEGTKEKLYRIRKGNYRIIYFVQNELLLLPFLKLHIAKMYIGFDVHSISTSKKISSLLFNGI